MTFLYSFISAIRSYLNRKQRSSISHTKYRRVLQRIHHMSAEDISELGHKCREYGIEWNSIQNCSQEEQIL